MSQALLLVPHPTPQNESPWGTWMWLDLARGERLKFSIKFLCSWKLPQPFLLPRALVSTIFPNPFFFSLLCSHYTLEFLFLSYIGQFTISLVFPSNLCLQGFPIHTNQRIKDLSQSSFFWSLLLLQSENNIFAHPTAHRLRYPLCQNLLGTHENG